MEMGHRETGDFRQGFPVERLVDVLANITNHRLDAVRIAPKSWSIVQHI
jgi:hypothetical protein